MISSKTSDDPTFKKNHEAWKFFEGKTHLTATGCIQDASLAKLYSTTQAPPNRPSFACSCTNSGLASEGIPQTTAGAGKKRTEVFSSTFLHVCYGQWESGLHLAGHAMQMQTLIQEGAEHEIPSTVHSHQPSKLLTNHALH